MNALTVMHILSSNSLSGAENVVIQIIKQYDNRFKGIYVSLDGPIRDILQEMNVKFCPVPNMNINTIKKCIDRMHPDIIHAHDFTASVICSICCWRIPIISHLHHNAPWISRINLKSVLYAVTTYRYKAILLVSDSIRQQYIFRAFISKKSVVVGNAIDANEIRKKAGNADKLYDVVFCGRLEKVKNPERFLKIIMKAKERKHDISSIMIGDGALRNLIEGKIEEYGLQENVKLIGFQVNPYSFIAQSKLMLITSQWEGFGLVAAEALALKVPVVATNVGGLQEIVTNQCGCLYLEDDDAVEELISLLTNQQYYQTKMIACDYAVEHVANIGCYMDKIARQYK